MPTKYVDRHSSEDRNPEKRPPWVDMDPGLRREDANFGLKSEDDAFKLKLSAV